MEYFDGKMGHFEHQYSIYPSKTIFQLPVFDLPGGTTNIPTTVFFSLANIQHNSNINSAPSNKNILSTLGSLYMYIYIYIHMYVCIYVYIYIYIDMVMNTVSFQVRSGVCQHTYSGVLYPNKGGFKMYGIQPVKLAKHKCHKTRLANLWCLFSLKLLWNPKKTTYGGFLNKNGVPHFIIHF